MSSSLTQNTDGRRARGNKARAQILAHSTIIASVEGLEGLTIGRVAAEAGVGKGNIQVLFGDREALQLATLNDAVEFYKTTVLEPALGKETPFARLLSFVEGWYAFVAARTLPGGCFISAVSSEYRARPGRIQDQINAHRKSQRATLRNLIIEAKKAEEIRADIDADMLVFELLAYQAGANVASLIGDEGDFALARLASRCRLDWAAVTPRPYAG
jgi:AcrR family transcriptional regulator